MRLSKRTMTLMLAARKRASGPGYLSAAGGSAPGAGPAAETDGLPWGVAHPLMTEAAKNLAQLNAILKWEAEQQALADAQEPPK
jgi:hypothetical protein